MGPRVEGESETEKWWFFGFFENFAFSNSCNFLTTGPFPKFWISRINNLSWNARKWHRQPELLGPTHPSGTKRPGVFWKSRQVKNWLVETIDFPNKFIFAPKGLLCRRVQKSMFVCPSVMSRNRPIVGIGPVLWPPAKAGWSQGSQSWSLPVLVGKCTCFDRFWIIRGDVR